jgi:hypothetical protein
LPWQNVKLKRLCLGKNVHKNVFCPGESYTTQIFAGFKPAATPETHGAIAGDTLSYDA